MRRFDIVLSDLREIVKRKRVKIILLSLVAAFVGFSYAITRDLYYPAEASFRDKGKASSGLSFNMSDLLTGGSGDKHDSEAVSAMKSMRLMESLIRKENMQGDISEKTLSQPLLKNIYNNLVVEWAHFNRSKVPSLKDDNKSLKFTHIAYEGEVYLPLEITFSDETTYEVAGGGKGKLNTPFKNANYEFTLSKLDEEPLAHRSFNVQLYPIKHVAKDLTTLLIAKTDPDDRGIIRIKYNHPDRHFGTQFVNKLMLVYQDYLEEERDRISKAQLHYLQKREEEIGLSLKSIMKEHAAAISQDISSSGFTDTKMEMEFLTNQFIAANSKLMQINLDEKRLEKVLTGDFASFDQGSPGSSDAPIINDIFHKMRDLKLQQDTLDLALEDNRATLQEKDFEQDLNKLSILKACCQEADKIIGGNLDSPAALKAPQYRLDLWKKRLQNKEIDETQFDSYVERLKSLIHMQITSIEERMKHRMTVPKEYQGLNLASAKDLYVLLSHDRQNNESAIKQLGFVIKQLDLPDFEVTSLTSVVNDPVSNEKIMKASQLSHSLKDTANRTSRELDRIRDELRVQKEFLKMHLSESAKLLEIKDDLLKDKSMLLQAAMLEMTGREITVLEKQLYDYVTTRLLNLQIEKRMVIQHQDELKEQLASIPEKWMQEQLLEQHILRNQKMVENITGMVESKNISNNLELVQSAPLDWAVPPLHPNHPKIMMKTIMGGILGAFLATGFFLAKGLLIDTPLTMENLNANGFKTLGKLRYKRRDKTLPLFDQNLDTLRRGLSYLPHPSTLINFYTHHLDYTDLLVQLLKKRGETVVFLDLSFKAEGSTPGLKQYLAGSCALDSIIIDDRIASGGLDRFSNELLGQEKFKELLGTLKSQYDWVVASTPIKFSAAEMETLLLTFDAAFIGLGKENLLQMTPLLTELEELKKEKPIAFLQYQML